jgi:hypothetical protein
MPRLAINWDKIPSLDGKRAKIEMCPCGKGEPRFECAPTHAEERHAFRSNAKAAPKALRFIAADMESKRRESPKAGFDDVTMVGVDASIYDDRGKAAFAEERVFTNSDRSIIEYGRKEAAWHPGGCISQYVEYVISNPEWRFNQPTKLQRVVHVFHNGGRFDMNHLMFVLVRLPGVKVEPIVNGDRVIMIKVTVKREKTIKKKKRTFVKTVDHVYKWMDSGIPLSLAQIGKIIGERKLTETDMNMNEFDPRWRVYVLQDCKVLLVGMNLFQKTVNGLGGSWKTTLPGTAIDLFRRYHSLVQEDGDDTAIYRNRHFKCCPDMCKACFRVQCWSNKKSGNACKNKQVRDEVIAHWRWDHDIQAHIGECPWAPDGCAHFFFRRGFFGGRTEMFRRDYSDPHYNHTTKSWGHEHGVVPPDAIGIRPLDYAYHYRAPTEVRKCKDRPSPLWVKVKLDSDQGYGWQLLTGLYIRIHDEAKGWGWEHYRSKLRIYDINSSYPASLLGPMPVGRMFEYVGMGMFAKIWPNVLSDVDKRCGFIECTVYVPETLMYPPLPVRSDGKVKFPTGYISGVWTSNELREAVRLGCVIRSVNRHVWIMARAVFRAMITELWALRKEALAMAKLDPEGGHEGKAEVYKLIMNAFFGKWGMGEYRDEFLIADDDGLPDHCKPITGQEDKFGTRKKHVDEDYINPSIAAQVTSESRLRLLHLFNLVEDQNTVSIAAALKKAQDHYEGPVDLIEQCLIAHAARWAYVWYSDTDSITCNVDLPESKELGGLKREYAENDIVWGRWDTLKVYELWMFGPCPKGCTFRKTNPETKSRDIACDQHIHCIVKSKGLQDPTPEKLVELREGKKLAQRSIPKFRKLIRNGFTKFETKYEDSVDPITGASTAATKSMTMKYDKRTLDQVTGFTMPERFTLDTKVDPKRPKTTPNLKKFDSEILSVRQLEERWRLEQGIRLASP